MLTKIPPKVQNERQLANLKAQAIREKAFKLVVKLISWETAALDSVVVKSLDKITNQEWLKYKKQTLNISTSESVEKVKQKLAKTYESIKKNGGFI